MKSIRTILFTLSLLLITTAGIPYGHVTASSAPASGKVYQIGTDVTFAPFEFQDASGEFVGIDMDLLAAIAEDQNFRYEIKPMGFNAAVQALEANQVDGVIAGMSITEERKQKFDFSDPYFQSGVVMAIRENDDSIQGYEDLRGKRVAVKTGTEGYSFAESIADEHGFTIVPFDDSDQMYNDVRTGNSVACFDDYPVLAYGVQQNNGLQIVTDMEAGGEYGFAVGKDRNQELLEMFNTGLTNLRASGKYQEIIDVYLGENASVGPANQSRWELIVESSPRSCRDLVRPLCIHSFPWSLPLSSG
ncbi:glutamine transport system permease protein GlnP [Paenibacillus sp. JCM 10914]|nr:glutamine transport system permease protein GlnP [Paenibacillus sp. JCM 10914]